MLIRFLFAAVLAASPALAQRGGGGIEGAAGSNLPGDRGGLAVPNIQHTPGRLDQIAQDLKLEKGQKKTVKNILDEAQRAANPIRDQLVKNRISIGDAIQNGKSADDIKQLVGAEAALESQMAEIEIQAFARIYNSLQQGQRDLTRPLFAMMKGIFSGKNWNYPE